VLPFVSMPNSWIVLDRSLCVLTVQAASLCGCPVTSSHVAQVSLRYDLLRSELLRYDVWSTAGERRLRLSGRLWPYRCCCEYPRRIPRGCTYRRRRLLCRMRVRASRRSGGTIRSESPFLRKRVRLLAAPILSSAPRNATPPNRGYCGASKKLRVIQFESCSSAACGPRRSRGLIQDCVTSFAASSGRRTARREGGERWTPASRRTIYPAMRARGCPEGRTGWTEGQAARAAGRARRSQGRRGCRERRGRGRRRSSP
jgi:hypothetical protein